MKHIVDRLFLFSEGGIGSPTGDEFIYKFFEANPKPFAILGTNEHILYANQAFRKTFAWSEKDKNRQIIAQFFPSNLDAWKMAMQITRTANGFQGIISTTLPRESQETPLEVCCFRLNKGTPDEVTAFMASDVSSRVKATNELVEMEQRLQRLVQSGAVGFWEWGRKTGQTFVSSACREILQITEGASTFERWPTYFAPGEWNRILQKVRHTIRQNEQRFEIMARTNVPDEPGIWVKICGTIQRDRQQRLIAIHGSMTNVSNEHVMIARLQKLEEMNFSWRQLMVLGHLAGDLVSNLGISLTNVDCYSQGLALNLSRADSTQGKTKRKAKTKSAPAKNEAEQTIEKIRVDLSSAINSLNWFQSFLRQRHPAYSTCNIPRILDRVLAFFQPVLDERYITVKMECDSSLMQPIVDEKGLEELLTMMLQLVIGQMTGQQVKAKLKVRVKQHINDIRIRFSFPVVADAESTTELRDDRREVAKALCYYLAEVIGGKFILQKQKKSANAELILRVSQSGI